jgi:hypothetical protein
LQYMTLDDGLLVLVIAHLCLVLHRKDVHGLRKLFLLLPAVRISCLLVSIAYHAFYSL